MPDDVRPATWQDLIAAEAQKQQVDPRLALAVADKESSLDANAPRGTSGEYGLFQLMPGTAKGMGVDPADPMQNIRGGVGYLKQRLDANGNDVRKALAEYNAGPGRAPRTNYVDDVLGRLGKFQTYAPTQAQTSAATPAVGPPPSRSLSILDPQDRAQMAQRAGQVVSGGVDLGRRVLKGLDPRTSEGRANLAGAAGAAGLTAIAPELELPSLLAKAMSWATPAAGAYLGGATEQAGEDVAQGQTPSWAESRAAGVEQAKNDLWGQALMRGVGMPIARRLSAKWVSSRISTQLDSALEALKARTGQQATSMTPSEAGQAVHAGVYGKEGATKLVKDDIGAQVGAAAATGPRVDPADINAHIEEIRSQLNPGAKPGAPPAAPPAGAPQPGLIDQGTPPSSVVSTGKYAVGPIGPRTPAQLAREAAVTAQQQEAARLQAAAAAQIPEDHPLPKVLAHAQQVIADNTGPDGKVDFATVHGVKRMLDDTIDFDHPAQTQVEGATQGLRSTVRNSLRGHAPYDEANARYEAVAKLYKADAAKAIYNTAQTNPSTLVDKLDWHNPEGIQMMHDLVRNVPMEPEGTAVGTQQGLRTWQGVQDAYTHETFYAKGPENLVRQVRAVQASSQGPAFVQAMYGDPRGAAVWRNTTDLAQALQDAEARTAKFATSNLAHAVPLSGVVRDAFVGLSPGHKIFRIGSITRLLTGQGAGASEMLEHVAHSDELTKFVVNHVLTGPDPGIAMADFIRWYKGTGGAPDRPVASHDQAAGVNPAIGTPPTPPGATQLVR